MRRIAVFLIALTALAASPALAEAPKPAPQGQVRGFERLDRAPTPGEMVAAPSFELPQIDGPGMGVTPDPRITDDPAQPFGGSVNVQVGVAGSGYYAVRSPRSRELLGVEERFESFDRSSSLFAYTPYGYRAPLTAFSPGWRDYSFARAVSPSDIAGLPSVSAPRSFWGFRD